MAWSTIRKANETDVRRVREAAERFCKRHAIDTDGMDPESAINCEMATPTAKAAKIKRLWRQILKRVVGSADGIAYGYVGSHVE